MCIRCSGIHRGIGVHITRIKSVDLDTWLPDQIANIQRWGNRRANLYWEAHLRGGHQPPEHKMESFIRSKYESRRWALSPEIPEPESLDGGAQEAEPVATEATAAPATPRAKASSSRKESGIDLLGILPKPSLPAEPVKAQAVSPPSVDESTGGSLFDIDFSPTTTSAATAAQAAKVQKDNKADILSLFSNPNTSVPTKPNPSLSSGLAGLNLGGSSATSNPWATNSTFVSPPASNPSSQLFNSQDVWYSSAPAQNLGFNAFGDFSATTVPSTKKQPDAFSNLWD